MKQAMVSRLTGATAIGAQVGERVAWGGFQRGDAARAIAMFVISPGREWTHDGPDNLDRPRVQVDCRAATGDEAEALADLVQAEIEQPADVAGIRFHPAMIDGAGFIDEGEQEGGQPFWRASRDYQFYFEEID